MNIQSMMQQAKEMQERLAHWEKEVESPRLRGFREKRG